MVKKRFFDYEADVYVEPGDMSSQFVELKKIPVKFIELPPTVWWGLMGLGTVAAAGGGMMYYLKEEKTQTFNELVQGSQIDGADLTPLLEQSAEHEANGNSAFIGAGALIGTALVLTPFVVWEE